MYHLPFAIRHNGVRCKWFLFIYVGCTYYSIKCELIYEYHANGKW